MDFTDVVLFCAGKDDLVKEFNRLYGCRLGRSRHRTPMERAVDEATGFAGESDEDMAKFTAFVWNCIWTRLPAECFVDR